MIKDRYLNGLILVLLASVSSTATADELRKFTIDDAQRNGLLGFAASIDGQIAFAGAPAQTSQPGSGYLFDVNTGQEMHTLTPSMPRPDDLFGFNAKISGELLLVGDPGNPYGRTKVPGTAYLFDVNSGSELMRLTPDDSYDGDEFGYGINAVDDLAIIGAPNLGKGKGAAYLFDLQTGSQLRKLTADDAFDGSEFGFDVAVSDQFAIVGAPGNFDSLGFVPGFTYVFNVATGQQLHKLTAEDSFGGNEFGFDVAIEGNVAIIGAPNGGSGLGAAYLFDVSTGQQLAKLTPSDGQPGNDFGSAVDIEGDRVLVGASGLNSVLGAAYIFDVHNGNQLQKLMPTDIGSGDAFGASVSLSGSNVFIGAPQDDDTTSNAGAAYLFSLGGMTGDFNDNGTLDAADIDLLTQAVSAGNHPAIFDLNQDSLVNHSDRVVWVEELANTFFGDANLDGQFETGDLIFTLQAAEYEDHVPANSTWAEGDWNGDFEFDSGDLITALQTGAYEEGPRPATLAVPEPTALSLLLLGFLALATHARRR